MTPLATLSHDWRAFSSEAGFFLLHVPSSHVVEASEAHYKIVSGEALHGADAEAHTAEALSELTALADGFPRPPVRAIDTDIRAVSLNMAQGCNLRCTYCFAGDGDYGNKGMMSFETATAVLSQLAAGKDRFRVTFFGGEPMLNYGVIQKVVEWCETQPGTRYSFAITTNGTLLSKEKLEWMREKRFSMTLSYDGKGLQKKQRLTKDGGDSETMVERKLAAFGTQLDSLRSLILRATITRENIGLLEDAILSTLTSQNLRLAVSHHATALRQMQFTEEDIDHLAAVYKRVVDRLVATEDWDKLLRLDNVQKHLDRIKNGRTGQIACGAGVHYLTVSSSGAYYLCHRFNEDESENYGNVKDGLDTKRLAAVAQFRARKAEPCGSCWMREWCAGGCFHEHKAASGDKFTVDPLFCKLQGLEIEQAMRVYTLLLAKAPHLLDA